MTTCFSCKSHPRGKQCQLCHHENQRMFTLRLVSDGGNSCGGGTIYMVKPKDASRRLRLRHITNFIVSPADPYFHKWHDYSNRNLDLSPISRWEDIWTQCGCWFSVPPKLARGRLRSGIAHSYGNGLIAAVQTQNGTMYALHGVWG